MDDQSLTTEGLPPAGHGKVLLIACGAIAREVLAVVESGGWDHLTLTCLPAILHNTPERICDAVRGAVERHRGEFASIYVLYADCGTGGGLERLCAELGVEMLRGPHCYSFFEGNAAFEARDEITAFYLTDFLVRQFDAFVTKPLGLDRHPELRDMYFEHYTKLVYQAQTRDPALEAKARDCAAKLGLEYEYRFTGFGDLAEEIGAWAVRG
ncbi:DUF1638 domain-containing protein [Alphaproteobacteria bacterium KMM 3653]|uniref:DUF1638 domain-containing protein n=1 Tax=Harenicola maris TaxID=2841044 RepID=A0AAP2CLD7_9RHOB|nr:DUF1638 domain-containing protein [Harenicola maris]